jgi:addiction module HigA family antidote
MKSRGPETTLPMHPGEHLQEELEVLLMSAAELARKIEVPANRIRDILRGKRDVSADTAMRLGHFFGTSAQFWLNLQAICDLRFAICGLRSRGRARQSTLCRI